jgi:hypothetical protein
MLVTWCGTAFFKGKNASLESLEVLISNQNKGLFLFQVAGLAL